MNYALWIKSQVRASHFRALLIPISTKVVFLKTSEEKGVTYCAALNFLFSASSEWSFEVHELGKLVSSKVSQGMLHLLTLVEKVSSEP